MAVAILRRKINAESSLIYRLPPESLAMVASHLDIDDLFTAAHVSSHWRAILLSFPNLWSDIQYGNDEEMLTMLQWSKSAPLHVSVEFGTPPEEVTNSLYNNSARIVSLKSDSRVVLRKLFAHPMTSLKTLSIDVDGLEVVDAPRDLADEPAGVVPSLRALSVGGNIEGLGFCVPHLTHFKFHGWFSFGTDSEVLLSILGVFRQCPMLEVVDVGWGEELYHSENFVFSKGDVVSLPHLRYLAQEQYVRIDQPWLPDLLHLPRLRSMRLKGPPIAYSPGGTNHLSPPFLYDKSPYLSDIRRVKLGTVYHHSDNVIETFMEIVNGQGILLSFRKTITLGEAVFKLDPWAIIEDEINPPNLCALRPVNTGSPMVLCLDRYNLRRGIRGSTHISQGLEDLGNVTTLILSNSTVEPGLAALELEDEEEPQCHSTVHSLVIYSITPFLSAQSDIPQYLLRISRKRKIAGTPFRSVTLAICSAITVPPDDLAALNHYIERFELLTGDDVLDWDVDKYFIPNYDPSQRRRDEHRFDAM